MPPIQLNLSLSYLRNSDLLSTHWLENRLLREPEWEEYKTHTRGLIDQISQLWQAEQRRVELYNEQGLEHAFIQPVFEALGWKLNYQTFLRGRKPDYALFLDDTGLDAALTAGRNNQAYWQYPTLVADAKAWSVSLDRPQNIQNKREYPPEQIEWYLNQSQLNFAILTNGRLWRLIPRELGAQQRRFQTYLEFDLGGFLNTWNASPNLLDQPLLLDDFLRFYLLFSPIAFQEVDGREPLIHRAVQGSSEYRLGVGEWLKERAFEALRLSIEGFLAFRPNNLDPDTDLTLCREQSFVFLYRLLFLMYAEDRRLLPYHRNRLYTNNRSLGRYRDDIAGHLDRIESRLEADFDKDSTAIWQDLGDLFDLVDRGHRTYEVPAYNGGLFESAAHPFLAEKQIGDWHLARIIDQLSRAPDRSVASADLYRVDYHDLAIQHLGGIYEGLLELQPHYATEPMIVVSRRTRDDQSEKVVPATLFSTSTIPEPYRGYRPTGISYAAGAVYLLTDKGERRASGSFYTPDHIVDHIVQQTLSPLCEDVSRKLREEMQSVEAAIRTANTEAEREALTTQLSQLQQDFDNRVLQLRILDPAMGSGHFLIRACQYLAEEIATHPHTYDEHTAAIQSDESSLTYWKRQVAERCLYGVDMNLMAVELAKLALWLETVAADQPLTFLDHHLRHGNSLIGAKIAALGALPDELRLLENSFRQQVEEHLPRLLDPLHQIQNTPSDTLAQVKEKDRLFGAFQRAQESFRMIGDLWCATFTAEGRGLFTSEQYRNALESLAKPTQLKQLAAADWWQQAVTLARRSEMACFHWELEFPEVFFVNGDGRQQVGFDAIIGNPPYDVLSELETGHDLSTLKKFIEYERTYTPSRRGKNNLYKLFICRALDLLAEGGALGFITPMAVLGDDQAADIRRSIVEVGYFTGIEAFPQKDDPRNRVFTEAKLSTAVFTLKKERQENGSSPPFRARVHPGSTIEEFSPSLTLTTEQIPMYDPANFTIVSCSQADWDLATRIMNTGRMTRLREFVEFFQGEVNGTNEGARGNLVDDLSRGKLVTRGASICLYVPRPASQGDDLLLNVTKFLAGKGTDTKAFHHRYQRVGLQESCPQNNFRRVIASAIPEGEFCNHKVNYAPEHKSKLPLSFVLGLLNSKLTDWYFRLGSTNAAVSHYQLYNLPCPVFAGNLSTRDEQMQEQALSALREGNTTAAFQHLQPLLVDPPFSLALQAAIIEAVQQITAIEEARGEISRSARSALASAAQPFQDFIDRLLFALAGLTETEAAALEERLALMM